MLIKTEKMASLGVLSAGIAHEINNPLGVILGHVQLLLKQVQEKQSLDNPQEAIQLLETIESYTRRCSHIVNSLVEFSRQKQMHMMPVDVNQAVENALMFTRSRIENKNIELIKNLAQGLPRTQADQIHLEQVFINIIINAQASMQDQGKLEISSIQEDDKIRICFKDNGQGIAQENLSRIFEPFFSTKDPGQGSGLGLSLSYGIIQAHEGDIKVSSQVGVGTTVDLILPIKA
jgi:signal transduction histidine kinase